MSAQEAFAVGFACGAIAVVIGSLLVAWLQHRAEVRWMNRHDD